jgi:uncharacterized membrane protein
MLRKIQMSSLLLRIPLFILIDLIWLTLCSTFVSKMVLQIQSTPLRMKLLPGIVVYIAVAYLSKFPKSSLEAFFMGSAVYAVYDFTNLTIFEDYDWRFALADTTWGGILMTAVYNIAPRLGL